MSEHSQDGGKQTLDTLAHANRFNEWLYDTVKPFCKGSILEIGSGTGNISSFFINDQKEIMLSDVRQDYCELLRNRFPKTEVLNINIIHPQFEQQYANLLNRFDCVFTLNVVEHVKDHELAIRNASRLLKSGGTLLVLVPAYQWLYNGFDKTLEHYRRYTRKQLKALMSPQVNVIHSQYFNCAGIAGWMISGGILRKKLIPGKQIKIFNSLVPAFRLIDRLVNKSAGLSVMAVGTKR